MEYLDFELPIKELEDQLDKCKLIGEESDVDVTETCEQIEKKLEATRKEIFKNLTAWQRVQLSRHPSRPYTLDFIRALTKGSFMELHGDRTVKDDKAMVGGLGKIGDQSYMFIGQQKGYNTKTRQYRNFGMSNPEGYRKSSILNYVDNLQGDVLLIHGDQDDIVLLKHSMELVKKCVDRNIDIDLFVYPGHGHGVYGRDRIHLLEKIERYFNERLE